MKKILLFCALGFGLIALSGCGPKISSAYYDYSSKIIQDHNDGSYVIRAWGRSRNATMSYEVAKKQALKDILFNGVQAQSENISNLKPLITEINAEEKYEAYFNKFFADNGEWENFCSMKDRRWATSKYQRTNAQTFAQVTVTIFRAQLKQKLIEDGILAK